MANLVQFLSEKGIQVFESGRCGSKGDLRVHYYTIAGEQCVKAWQSVLKRTERTVIVMPENFNHGAVVSEDRGAVESQLKSYLDIDLPQWLSQQWGDYDFDQEEDQLAEMMEEAGQEISNPKPSHEFSLPYEVLSRQPLGRMWLVDFTGIKRHEIPIYLQYGGWNACPMPEIHAALLQRWSEKYGAELFGLSGDVLEVYVKNPPSDYEAAHTLAKEQMAYCDDIVFQGTMTVERLAKGLMDSSSWYFWWD